uniref:Cytochrome c oxidase subunit 2 n=1 Tax=Trialeurodes vaporariorum TaxID=88556 RepID=Q674N8_TRIVP|nr:cytochrome c oxidase subunit II [Trialeurodes vaporariorum]AAU14222.1 cytochrome oxidase subunit II [Trialeurodes vaporariorum]
MTTWLSLSFQDGSSYTMEYMTFFFDFSFMVILMVLVFVIYMLVFLTFGSLVNRFLLDNQFLEFLWTVFPVLIIFMLAFPSIRILYLMDEMKNPTLTFKALGHQWFWSYEYSDFKLFEFDSYMILGGMVRLLEVDNSLVIPLGLKIRLLISSFDVLHSWTVPSLGVKVDAVPGRLNQLNFTLNRLGVFYGQCSEICGVNHSFMPIAVEGVSMGDFKIWLYNF